MANILNTLNLIQVKGGVNIKQGDNTSILEYELGYTNTSNMMTDPMLDGKTANINLYNRLKNTKWSRQSTVKGNRVSFAIDEALELGVYMLDIEVDGHVFPSDGESRIRIHEGYESYMDGRSAAVAVATAKNIANEAIRLAVLENVDKIKGDKGDVGPIGPKGETGPIGPIGPKGEDGKDCEVIDNLESEDGEKALSARQGKILNKKYDELFYDVDNGKNLIAKAIVDKKGKANKNDSFIDLANKIGEIKTGWEPGHKFSQGELKAEYEYYSDEEPSPVIENIDGALSVPDTSDFYFITKGGKLSLFNSSEEILSSEKRRYLNLWRYMNNRCLGVVSADNNGFISIYGISMILEELWTIDTKIPSNKIIELVFAENTLVALANDKSIIEGHNLANKKCLRLYNYDNFYNGFNLLSIQNNNTVSAMNSNGDIFTFNLGEYKLDKIIYCNKDSLDIHTSDKKIYQFEIRNGVLQNPTLKIDLSQWAKGELLFYRSYSSGDRYTYEGISLLVEYDKNVTVTYTWEYDKSTEVKTDNDNLRISHVQDDVKITEVINLFTKEKKIEKSPNFKKVLKQEYTESSDHSTKLLFFVLNGNLCSWSITKQLMYYILPELPESRGD